jgi:hypothetical protein
MAGASRETPSNTSNPQRSKNRTREITLTDMHSKECVLDHVLTILEREVEWPLTDYLDPEKVSRLLAPLRDMVNSELIKEMNKRESTYG